MTDIVEINTASYKENTAAVTETLMTAFDKTNKTLPFMERTEKILPGISGRVNEKMTYEEIYFIVEDMILKKLEIDKNYIENTVIRFRDLAKKILFEAVEKMIEMFSAEYAALPVFKCRLGVYNPFPRSVLKKEYFLHYDISDEVFLRASLHEINHMILFDKWKSMHGCDNLREPEFPDVLWFLEELAIEPTLNDGCMQKIVPIKHKAYDSLKKTEINGVSLTSHIQRIYDGKKNMEDFLDAAYDFLCGKEANICNNIQNY